MLYDKPLFRRFISYYKPHKLLLVTDLAAALLLAAIELVYPAATTQIIDVYIPAGQIKELLIMVGVLVVFYIIMAGLHYFMNYWGHVMGVRMEADMRSDFFVHLQRMPFKFFDKMRTGKLMSRIINDLNQVSEMAHHAPEDLFISTVMFVGSFIVLFQREWRLTLILYLGVIPSMVWFSITQRKKMSKGFKKVRERTADINAQLENALAGIRVSQSFTNEQYEIDRFNESNHSFKIARKEALKKMASFHSGMHFLITLLNAITLGFGGFFAIRGHITFGELTGFLLYVNLVMQPIRRLTNFTQQFEQGMTGFQRFDEIMRMEPDIVDGHHVAERLAGHIIFDDVTFAYNDKEQVLTGISLDIAPGQTVALVGPSGGGKTTLCHLIPRFYDIQAGALSLDGINIKDYTLSSLRKNIGLVQQDVFLFTGTIRDNILYGHPEASEDEMIAAARQANIHDFVTGLQDGYDTWVGEKGIRLSGGQKQRISIARVFLKNPSILILDEATSSLDNETEIKIQQSLEHLTSGRTTLIIAHRLSTIRSADVIFVLSADGIVESGSHSELYAQEDGLYRSLYDAQFYAEEHKKDLFA